MPFYRCSAPSSDGGGDSETCEHIIVTHNGLNYGVPVWINNNIAELTSNIHGNNLTFNCPVTIGDAVIKTENLFQYCYNFNSYVDMSNATNLNSVNQMFYYCPNYNQPTYFPNTVQDYFSTFRFCPNYNQPTELYASKTGIGTMASNFIGTFMTCYNMNSRINIKVLSENAMCVYDSFLYYANNFNQPMIFKKAASFNRLFEKASNMRCPIVIDFAKNANNVTTGNNCAWDGCIINNVIFLNYVNQKIAWEGTATNVTFYVNDPYTFVNQCTSLYRQGAKKYNYIPIENGLQADVSWYNIRVLSNVLDGLNYFNNFYYNCYGEYPNYN